MSKFTLQTRVSDTLATTMAAGASTCTLTSGNFGSPTGKQIITLDYDVAAKAADFLCTIAGTAVTAMTRLNGPDVEHSAAAKVTMNFVDEHYALLMDTLNDGWLDPKETWTYASATTITVPAGAASRYAVGDKIKLTQTTVKYFYVVAVADTVLTVTGGTDYTVANAAITANYYSKQSSPVGFPDWFTYTVTRSSSGGNAPSYTLTDISKFKITGRNCTVKFVWQNNSGGTAGSGTGTLTNSLPVTGVFADTSYAGFETLGTGNIYEAAETIDVFTVNPLSATTVGFLLSTATIVIGTHQSTTVRRICTTFSYEI